MDFAPTFQMGHPIAFQAAAKARRAYSPTGLDRIFFTNSGSESADTALKIALAYHRARGQSQRVRLIGRARGYHGVGFGGMSVGGIGTNRKQFGAQLPYVDHLPHTHSIEHNAFTRGQPALGRPPGRGTRGHSWRCTASHDRGRHGRACRGLDGRADPASGLSRSACANSARSTASC